MPVKNTNEKNQSSNSVLGVKAAIVGSSGSRSNIKTVESNEIKVLSARPIFSSRTLAALVSFLAANVAATVSYHPHMRSLVDAVRTNLHSASLTGKSESWWMVKDYLRHKKAPDVVLLGSSQMQCFYTADAAKSGHDVDELLDHDCKVLTEQLSQLPATAASQKVSKLAPDSSKLSSPSCFNASLAGSMISDRYLVDRALLNGNRAPKVVVLGIAPRDFIDNTLPSISATEPFQFFTPSLDVRDIDDSAFASSYDKLSWEFARKLPLRHVAANFITGLSKRITEFATITTKTTTETATSRAEQVVVDSKPFFFATDTTFNVKPGKCLIPHTPFAGFINNNHEYAARYKQWNTTEYRQQMRYFDLLLADLSRKNIRTVLVGMPLDAMNADLLPEGFWRDYYGKVLNASTSNGVSFVDLARSTSFAHSDFADGVHLNWRGANKLAKLLAEQIWSISQAAP